MDYTQFIDSPEMREHLKTVQLAERTCEELVCGSPRPLTEKLAWLEQQGSARAEEARRALDGLKLRPGEFLFLLDEWYDYNCFGRSHGLGFPVTSLDAAVRHIRRKMTEEGWDKDSLFWIWTRLDKWVLGEDGTYHCPYTYYFVRDEVVYFQAGLDGPPDSFCGTPDLDIPIPFRTGNIVTINCLPFMPYKRVVLLEVDNSYCCGVNCLFQREEDGKWEIGTIKHSRCWAGLSCEFPVISPLYRLASVHKKLGKDDRLLEKVSNYIDGNERRGKNLWENLNQEMNSLNRYWMDEQEVLGFLR